MPSSSSSSITAGFAGGISGTFTPQPPLDTGTAAVVPPPVCICNRPPGVLLCQTCGFQTGVCPLSPIFLPGRDCRYSRFVVGRDGSKRQAFHLRMSPNSSYSLEGGDLSAFKENPNFKGFSRLRGLLLRQSVSPLMRLIIAVLNDEGTRLAIFLVSGNSLFSPLIP